LPCLWTKSNTLANTFEREEGEEEEEKEEGQDLEEEKEGRGDEEGQKELKSSRGTLIIVHNNRGSC